MTLTTENTIEFLVNSLDVSDPLDAETELFSGGLLDSVAMLNLIGFVEETSRIEVHPGDVTLDNFDTVSRILQYVESRL